MAGHINFRNDVNIPFTAEFNNVSYFVLCVVSAVNGLVFAAEAVAVAERSDPCELRIFFNFNSPALVIGQMPVENVELIERGGFYVFFNFINGLHMT